MSQFIQATVQLNSIRRSKILITCQTNQGQQLKLSGPSSHPVLASLKLGDSIRVATKNRKWQQIERCFPKPISVEELLRAAASLTPIQKLSVAMQLLRQCQVTELERSWHLS